jgi:hypothetical protein
MPDLDLALRQLALELDWPDQPSLARAVGARLREPRRRRLGRLLVLAFAVLAAALAVALAVPPARSAILDFLRIGGVEVRRVETVPPLPAERVAPGPRVTLAEAREAVTFDLVVPRGYTGIHLDGGIVTFTWSDRLLMELSGDELLLKKVADQRSRVEWLEVEGNSALWIEGAPHGFYIPGGEPRLAGNVLLWVHDGVTLRLEGDLTLRRALAIAGTLTPRGT